MRLGIALFEVVDELLGLSAIPPPAFGVQRTTSAESEQIGKESGRGFSSLALT